MAMVTFQNESSTISDTIDRMINTSTTTSTKNQESDENRQTFIPSSIFQGSKEGYYFGTTVEHGTGYHLDSNANNKVYHSKRKAGLENNDDMIQKKKRLVRFTDDGASSVTTTSDGAGAGVVAVRPKRKTGEEMLAEIEKSMTEDDNKAPKIMGQLDAAGIKSAAFTLQKMFQKNQLKRAQYPEEPEQFMESELALNDEIESLKAIATNLSLYPLFIKLILPSLQNLLSHENVDIALTVIALLVELMDPALLLQSLNDSTTSQIDLDDNNKYMKQLVDETMEFSSIDLIISNLGRLDVAEEEEAVGIENILTLVENALDFERTFSVMDPSENDTNPTSIVSSLLSNTSLLSWLFHRISQTSPATNDNTSLYLHITEILATILQHNEANLQDISCLKLFKSAFDEDDEEPPKKDAPKFLDGVEILLQSIAVYRKKDPKTEEECECLENIFDALSASLLHNSANLCKFIEAQGIELMLRCIREKVHSGHGALKVFYFCLSSSELSSIDKQPSYQYTKQACETFVDVGGLKYVFPLLLSRKSALPKPAKCSDAGSDLAKRKDNVGRDDTNKKKKLGKLAKLAVSARKEWIQQIETHAIQIIYYLTLHLDETSQYDAKARLLAKFLEDEKCDKLIDLCLKYDEKMRLAEYKFYRSDEAEELEENGLDVDLAALDAKLKGGGDLFYRLGAIIAFVCSGSKRCHERVLGVLKKKDSGIGVVKAAIEGFISILDDNKQKDQLQKYLEVV